MLPADFIRAMEAVQRALDGSRVEQMLRALQPYSEMQAPSPSALLACFASIAAQYDQFSADSRAIMQALQLQPLVDPDWWARLLSAVSRAAMPDDLASTLAVLHARLDVATGSLPDLTYLLDPDSAPQVDGTVTLTLILPHEDAAAAAPRRVAGAIGAVGQIWDALGRLVREPSVLTLAACETGPATKLVFTSSGLGQMPDMKSLLLSVWDQVVMDHGLSAADRAARIPARLPIMEQIQTLAGADAPAVQRSLQEGVRQFLEAGCLLPEMRDPGLLAPERLMVPSVATPAPASPIAATDPVPQPTGPAPVDDQGILAEMIAEERQRLAATKAPPRPPRWLSQGQASSNQAL
jgi:hypothetical protein